MSLYSLIFETNPFSDLLLQRIGLKRVDFGRFLDVSIEKENGEYFIVVFTRNGGGNRQCSCRRQDGEFVVEDSMCPGCIITEILPRHPNYVCDYDNKFDDTYASIKFSVPKRSIEYVENTYSLTCDMLKPDDRIGEMLIELNKKDSSYTVIQEASMELKVILDRIFSNISKHKKKEDINGHGSGNNN